MVEIFALRALSPPPGTYIPRVSLHLPVCFPVWVPTTTMYLHSLCSLRVLKISNYTHLDQKRIICHQNLHKKYTMLTRAMKVVLVSGGFN